MAGDNRSQMSMRLGVYWSALSWLDYVGAGPVVRWGALLSALLVAAAYLMPTPVGTNATRLPELFAAPLIAAVAARSLWSPSLQPQ